MYPLLVPWHRLAQFKNSSEIKASRRKMHSQSHVACWHCKPTSRLHEAQEDIVTVHAKRATKHDVRNPPRVPATPCARAIYPQALPNARARALRRDSSRELNKAARWVHANNNGQPSGPRTTTPSCAATTARLDRAATSPPRTNAQASNAHARARLDAAAPSSPRRARPQLRASDTIAHNANTNARPRIEPRAHDHAPTNRSFNRADTHARAAFLNQSHDPNGIRQPNQASLPQFPADTSARRYTPQLQERASNHRTTQSSINERAPPTHRRRQDGKPDVVGMASR